jgi:hypothetical protein
MKIKKIVVWVVLALFIVSSSMQGQGIYSNSKEKKAPPKGTTNGGIYKAPGDPGGGVERDDETPLGDGLLILTLMAGGYFIAKRRKIRKNEI